MQAPCPNYLSQLWKGFEVPEGPEIKRLATRLNKVLTNQPLEELRFSYRDLDRFDDELRVQKITNVDSRGKALLVFFESGLTLYSHNQLYGKWLIVRKDKKPKTNRTQRLVISTSRHSAFLYSASNIELLEPEDLELHPYLAKLGPDALDEETKWAQVYQQLTSSKFEGRSLGSLLLDQHFVGGIGNYLRSEILYVSRLNPIDRPKDLAAKQKRTLSKEVLRVTKQAFLTAGVTNDLSRVSRLKELGLSRSKYRFAVFARTGLPCYECGEKIIRSETNGRRLYSCPVCQPSVRTG